MAFFEVKRFAAIQQMAVDTGSNVGTQVALPLVRFGQNSPVHVTLALDPAPHHSFRSVEVIESPFGRASGCRRSGVQSTLGIKLLNQAVELSTQIGTANQTLLGPKSFRFRRIVTFNVIRDLFEGRHQSVKRNRLALARRGGLRKKLGFGGPQISHSFRFTSRAPVRSQSVNG